MEIEEIYTYLLSAFEGKSFENIILNKKNTNGIQKNTHQL